MAGYLNPPHRPRFREYYPSFSIVEARRAIAEGRVVCLFHLGPGTVGQLMCWEWRPMESLLLKLEVGMPFVERHDAVLLRLAPVPTGLGANREALVCPQCEKPKFVIFCAPSWACAKCNRLMYRSQLANRDAVRAEKLEALEVEMRHGRPAGMHNSTYRRRQEELRALRQAVRSRAKAYANFDHQRVTRAEWVEPSQVQNLWFPDFQVEHGSIVPFSIA